MYLRATSIFAYIKVSSRRALEVEITRFTTSYLKYYGFFLV